MITTTVRARQGSGVAPQVLNPGRAHNYKRRNQSISGLGVAMLVRPGPNGGTEVVDPSGNVIYTEDQVAANPTLLSSLPSPCPGGMLPTWYPGGESVCADQNARTPEGITPFAQFNYPVNGQCPVNGWCLTGSDPTNPNSFTWQGGGQPTTLNPAIVNSARPLPSVFTTPDTPTTALAVQNATSSGNPQSVANIVNAAQNNQPVAVSNPAVTNVLTSTTPTTSPAPQVTPQAIANGSPQTGNQNMNAGAGATNASGDLLSQVESGTGLSGTTLGLIAAGILAFMVFKK